MSSDATAARVQAKVDQLGHLRSAFADGLLDQLGPFSSRRFERYRLIGMGQSYIAARASAAKMRALGLNAAAEPASSRYGYPLDRQTLVIAVTASGRTDEVLRTLDRLDGHFPVLAVTNRPTSAVSERAGAVLPIHAGEGADLLCLNSFPHTALVLQSLAVVFSGGLPRMVRYDLTALIDKVAASWQSLQTNSSSWLDDAADLFSAPAGVVAISPAERLGSAWHSAQVLRQGAHLPSWAYETADYCHSGVAATTAPPAAAPAALLYTGSAYDEQTVSRLSVEGSTVVAVGAAAAATADSVVEGPKPLQVRFAEDDDTTMAHFAESHVADLITARLVPGERA